MANWQMINSARSWDGFGDKQCGGYDGCMSKISLKEMGLRPAVARKVASEAKKAGKSPMDYIRWLVEKQVDVETTFAEILKPVREAFHKSEVTAAELEGAVEEARSAHWQRTRRKKK